MSDVDIIGTVVVSALTSGATRIITAPFEGVGDAVREAVAARVGRTLGVGEAKSHGRPLEVNDRVAIKVLNEAAWTDDEVIADYLWPVAPPGSFAQPFARARSFAVPWWSP